VGGKARIGVVLSRSTLSLVFARFFLRAFGLFFGFALAGAKAPAPTSGIMKAYYNNRRIGI
jgi:hypothetical protein